MEEKKMFDLFKKEGSKVVHVNDMDSLLGKVNLIDIRETYEVRGGTLKGAKNIPMGNLLETPEKYLKKEEEYYILCQSGARSSAAVRTLSKLGYQVVNVAGGFGSYAGSKRA
jgi:rhodanese-related sulfurtransferase